MIMSGNTSNGGGKFIPHDYSLANDCREQVCWIPILKSAKLILAGDPLQVSRGYNRDRIPLFTQLCSYRLLF